MINFHGLNMPEDVLIYEDKYYLQVYLENCTHKTVDKQMADYFDENLFEDYTL